MQKTVVWDSAEAMLICLFSQSIWEWGHTIVKHVSYLMALLIPLSDFRQ